MLVGVILTCRNLGLRVVRKENQRKGTAAGPGKPEISRLRLTSLWHSFQKRKGYFLQHFSGEPIFPYSPGLGRGEQRACKANGYPGQGRGYMTSPGAALVA